MSYLIEAHSPLNGPTTSSIIGSLVARRQWVTLAESGWCDVIANGAVCCSGHGIAYEPDVTLAK